MTVPRFFPPLDELARRVTGFPVVGISSYGGSGKTTLATALAAAVGGAVIGIDEFATAPVMTRSPDFAGFDRDRLLRQVLAPFRRGDPTLSYDRCDSWTAWTTRPVVLDRPPVLVVEGIGLFHPALLPHLDHTVWLDVDLTTATARGVAREAALGREQTELWSAVWAPNEVDFERRFRPREQAGTLVVPDLPAQP